MAETATPPPKPSKSMAEVGESSSVIPVSTNGDKPVVVRVKRKLRQSVLDAFWLEINEQPSKRAALDFAKLSLGDSASGYGDEPKARKVLVQHVETISTSVSTISAVQSFVPYSADVVEPKTTKRAFKSVKKQEQILSKSRLSQEQIAKSARFRQIWSSRRENEEGLNDMCNFYDVVRLDAEEESSEVKQKDVLSMEEQKLLSSYLPFLRELIPNAAEDIEVEISSSISQGDDYVYDYYTVNDSMDITDEDMSISLPLVQVEDDDFYDGPDEESEYDSEDSNAENHPYNEYPDECLEEEDELQSEEESTEHDEDEEEEEDDEGEGNDNDDDDDERDSYQNFHDLHYEDRDGNDDLLEDYLVEADDYYYDDSSDAEKE
ncbi:RNA-directed DNA methylation 4 [Linum perenne]